MLRLHLAAALVASILLTAPGVAQPRVPVGPITVASPGSSGFMPGNLPSLPTRNASGPGYGTMGWPYYSYNLNPYGYPFSPNIPYDPVNPSFGTPIGPNDVPPPPLLGAGFGSSPSLKLTGMPAALTLQFPDDATVWLNGREVSGDPSKTRELASPSMAIGTAYSFDVRAEWAVNGVTYEYENTVKVPAGDRSKITVLAGTPKKSAP